MSATSRRSSWLTVLLLTALTACGGGGGNASGGGVGAASGGIGGSGISFGAITQFGSIFVNGVEFDTGSAVVTLEGSPGPDAGTDLHRGLKIGMVVRVNGIFDDRTGTAVEVEFEDNVQGPISAITPVDAHTKQLTVLGQTVIIDDTQTQYENTTFATIAQNDFVEVSGLTDDLGRVRATFIQKELTAPAAFEVKGLVQNVDASSKTFAVNALTVDYRSAALDNFPGTDPANGQFVEVKGHAFNALGQLVADSVELKRLGVAAADVPRVEVEGFVTAFTSSTQFTVGNQPVVTTVNTLFVGGVPSEIAPGSKLEVEGSLAAGVLTATKVEFEDSIRLESNATVSGATVTLGGLPGITVTTNAFTDFVNSTANLASLNGRALRIRGRASGPTSVIATEVEDRGPLDPNGDVILQGPVAKSDVSAPTFKILGVVVDTSGLDPNEFKDVNDSPLGSSAAFFRVLASNGGLVKAKGQLPAANALTAGALKEVELED